LDTFIHKIYINVARKLYTNVYLFENNISQLLIQKNNREIDIIIQECILTTIRESIPTESIIRAYIDESAEQEEEVIIENIPEEPISENVKPKDETIPEIKPNEEENIPEIVPSIIDIDNKPVTTRLSFNDYDSVLDIDTGNENSVIAPKDIDRLEEISNSRAIQRRLDEEESDDDYDDMIKIHSEDIILDDLEILDEKKDDGISLDIEELF
jgi:hypothetical protein